MHASSQAVVGYLRSLLARHRAGEGLDRDLLRRFAETRDGDAFSLLLQRYGPMVLGLARRVVGDYQLAEDVFQATFLALARKAHTIRRPEALPGWLHGVAFRLALRARRPRARPAEITNPDLPSPSRTPLDELTAREFLSVLDEELQRLPDAYRGPVLLCCLEGLSQEEAAQRLGCTPGSVKGRLERGRARLRLRLEKRGLMLPAVLAGPLVAGGSAVAVPPALFQTTLGAAVTGTGASPAAAALAQGAIQMMFYSKLKMVCAAGALLVLVGAGVGVMAMQLPADKGGGSPPPPAANTANPQPAAPPHGPGRDLHGDPLPAGAVMRLGTLQRRAVDAQLAMSADGRSIVGVRAGKYVSVWDAATGKLKASRALAAQAWTTSVLSGDGRWLVSDGLKQDHLTLRDVQTDKAMHHWRIRGWYLPPPVFSADEQRIAVIGYTAKLKQVRVWEVATGKEVFAKDVPGSASSQLLAISPDGKRLLATFGSIKDGTFCWDIPTGELVWQNKEFFPDSVAITPDGKILSTDSRIAALDLATGRPVAPGKLPPLGRDNRLTLTPDGRNLLVTSPRGVIVWNLISGKEVLKLAGAGEEIVVSPDGQTILSNDGSVQRWDLATGKPLYPDNFADGHLGEVFLLAFSADGRRLASGSADGSVRLWDVTTGKPIHVWRGHQVQPPLGMYSFMKAGVTALDLSPDGRWILSAGTEGGLRLRDGSTGQEIPAIRLPDGDHRERELHVLHLRISPDSGKAVGLFGARHLVVAKGDNRSYTHKLSTWDMQTGKLLSAHPVEPTQAKASAISPDGRTLLSKGALIDMGSGREILRLEGGTGSDLPRDFSRDGFLVVGDSAKETKMDRGVAISPGGVRVWEAVTGKTVAHLKTKSWVGQVAFHPDNRFIVTNELDGIQIWDAITGQVIITRPMHETIRSRTAGGIYASCLAFTPDGRRLATGHPDSTILLWGIALPPNAPKPLGAGELDSLWADLRADDAARAWKAVWRLGEVPQAVLPYLQARLRPVQPTPADVVRPLLADLDNASFQRREAATKRLQELGPRAEAALRQALQASPSQEKKRRIEAVLAVPPTVAPPSPDELRQLRAVAVLGRVGSPEARRLLEKLAAGVESAPLTRAAKAALLGKR